MLRRKAAPLRETWWLCSHDVDGEDIHLLACEGGEKVGTVETCNGCRFFLGNVSPTVPVDRGGETHIFRKLLWRAA